MVRSLLSCCALILVGCSVHEDSDKTESKPAQLSPEDDPAKKGHLFSGLNHEQEEDVALAINAAGYLCAKVVGALPSGGRIIVECTEYRNKSDSKNSYVRYMIRGLEGDRPIRVFKTDKLTVDGWEKVKS